jgi:CheY-like chemotaxis protein
LHERAEYYLQESPPSPVFKDMRDADDDRKDVSTSDNRRLQTTRRDFLGALPGAFGAVVSLQFAPQRTIANPGAQCRSSWCHIAPTVWIVDDDAALGELYELVLGPTRYATRIFQDRLEALRFLRQANERPSLLITDFLGHPLSTDSFLQCFRREHPQIKVLMATGCDQSCLESCVSKPDRFLQKPFCLQVLVAEVVGLLGEEGEAHRSPPSLQNL